LTNGLRFVAKARAKTKSASNEYCALILVGAYTMAARQACGAMVTLTYHMTVLEQ
jgi:hypothetical protein